MKTNAFRQTIVRKALLLVLPLVLLLGFAATSAEARDYHRGRYHRGNRHAYVNRGYYGGSHYRHGYYGGRRHYHDGYWRYRRGHRYWYQDGGYYSRPGGLSISLGF